jgi:tRNA A-37 threonylcarbamoyl transferase component Bud32
MTKVSLPTAEFKTINLSGLEIFLLNDNKNSNNNDNHEAFQAICDAIQSGEKAILCNLQNQVPLSGRSSTTIFNIPGYGETILKSYRRGGAFRWIAKSLFLKCGHTRSELETLWTLYVRSLGISAPKPLAYVWRGKFFYQAWLCLEAIKESQSIAEISLKDRSQALKAVAACANEISKLIRARVQHVDLHPGNILVKQDLSVFLIDFDKAQYFHGKLNLLRDFYLYRWRRAVIKHQLPEFLTEAISLELRKNYEEGSVVK